MENLFHVTPHLQRGSTQQAVLSKDSCLLQNHLQTYQLAILVKIMDTMFTTAIMSISNKMLAFLITRIF